MARKGIKTSNVAVVPPAKVKIEDLVKGVYSQAVMIIPTGHAKKRLEDREVTLQEVRQVLSRSGSRKASKDQFCKYDAAGNEINRWSYAFVGRTTDRRKLRVCVSVVENPDRKVLIVTVLDEE